MRIGIDMRSLQDGRKSGVEEYTTHIVKNILKQDTKNTYILFFNALGKVGCDKHWAEEFPHVIVKRLYLPNKILNFFLWYFRWPKIDTLLGGVDIFFAPNHTFIALSPSVQFILTVHDISWEMLPSTFSWKRRLWHTFVQPKALMRRADAIIAVSHSTKRDIVSYLPEVEKKIKVVHSGIAKAYRSIDRNDVNLLRIKEKYNLPYSFILFLGTSEPRKNIQTIVRAYALFRKKNVAMSKYSLVIAGVNGWDMDDLRKEIDADEVREYIHSIGEVDEVDKVYLYNLASLTVFPSWYEGFGFPVLESMACATPVVVSHEASLSEIVSDGGILVNPQRPDDWADAFFQLLSQRSFLLEISVAGKLQSRKFFWEKSAHAVIDSINKISHTK